MEQLTTTYTVKMQNGDVWQFKYNLNGILVYFNVLEGDLSKKQEDFLYVEGKFPYKVEHIKKWKSTYKTIIIEVGEPNLTFETFWKMYPYNGLSKKKIAKERWDKLTDSEKIKLLLKIPEFKKLKTQQNTAYPYAEVFINQRWWDQ
jgi:hypothetical protein